MVGARRRARQSSPGLCPGKRVRKARPQMDRHRVSPGFSRIRANFVLSSRAGGAPGVAGWREGQSTAEKIPRDSPCRPQMKTGDSSSRSTAHALPTTPAVPPIRNDSAKLAHMGRQPGATVFCRLRRLHPRRLQPRPRCTLHRRTRNVIWTGVGSDTPCLCRLKPSLSGRYWSF